MTESAVRSPRDWPQAALQAEVTALLTAWSPPDPAQAALREAYLGFLAARPDATQRSCAAGHLTASAVVMPADRSTTLLTLHPRVGRWLQLGGHCEPGDISMAQAALREAVEESGITDLRVVSDPIHLDVHPIICSLGVPTRHFDVQFLVIAPPGAQPVISDESLDLRFFPIDDLPPDTDDGLRRALHFARRCRKTQPISSPIGVTTTPGEPGRAGTREDRLDQAGQ